MRFKYHPDNTIYINGAYFADYGQFVQTRPTFPISEGDFFEYDGEKLEIINNEGHHFEVDIDAFEDLVTAINGLSV